MIWAAWDLNGGSESSRPCGFSIAAVIRLGGQLAAHVSGGTGGSLTYSDRTVPVESCKLRSWSQQVQGRRWPPVRTRIEV